MSVGGGGFIGVNRLFFNFMRPELSVGLGAYTQPVDVVTMIRVGSCFEWPNLGRIHPFVLVSFAHQHEAGSGTREDGPLPHRAWPVRARGAPPQRH
jgi:hypothetical protein